MDFHSNQYASCLGCPRAPMTAQPFLLSPPVMPQCPGLPTPAPRLAPPLLTPLLVLSLIRSPISDPVVSLIGALSFSLPSNTEAPWFFLHKFLQSLFPLTPSRTQHSVRGLVEASSFLVLPTVLQQQLLTLVIGKAWLLIKSQVGPRVQLGSATPG